jgi:hypothetical protein
MTHFNENKSPSNTPSPVEANALTNLLRLVARQVLKRIKPKSGNHVADVRKTVAKTNKSANFAQTALLIPPAP